MNKLKLILGIGSLVIAAGLVYANLTLPPERIWFDIGYGNMPWVPPVVFAIVGIILLATAKQPEKEKEAQAEIQVDPERAAMNKRLETIAWGCFLIMWAGFLIWPKVWMKVPDGLWSIGVGLIMLGLNAARYFNKIRMSGFTTVLGILSVIGGVVQLLGVTDIEGAFLLIILGGYLILKPYFEKRQLFGKAEQS